MKILSSSTFRLVALFVLFAACTTGCSQSVETKTFVLDPQKVTAISASITNHPDQLSSDSDANIDEFQVPSSMHGAILDLLQNATLHQSANDWAVLGELKLTTADGVHTVTIYSAGEEFIFDIPDGPEWDGGQYEAKNRNQLIRAITSAKNATVEVKLTQPKTDSGGG